MTRESKDMVREIMREFLPPDAPPSPDFDPRSLH